MGVSGNAKWQRRREIKITGGGRRQRADGLGDAADARQRQVFKIGGGGQGDVRGGDQQGRRVEADERLAGNRRDDL